MSQRTAVRTHTFTESVIRDMTRVARRHGAINLAQGFPDFPAPGLLKDAACRAIRDDVNQYAITWGTPCLRTALAAKYAEWYGLEVDAEREITVTCGATEAMAAVMLAAIDPGEEVVILEPFYENYGPDAVLCDAAPVFVPLSPPGFRLDPDRLAAAITKRTRAIVVNTPNNPTGRVFDRDELDAVARICTAHDILAITDEIYEHIVYDGEHLPLATFPGMRERTVVISGASKTFSVTGWRIGTIVAPAALNSAIRKVHDFLTVGAPAPLQDACAAGLDSLGADYYEGLARDYRERRDILYRGLCEAGFRCLPPEGAYYIMADFSALSSLDDTAFSTFLARECGVAPVPGSSFYHRPEDGHKLVRFAFCKRTGTLARAVSRLRRFFA
ncbi:MAG: aminotransferase class I/II-fold pyridoxal phosphate-dependent enzyme [Gemmatimonadota bacterium]|nr:aminotransferase class I/II-fold pyridoxal phosphate-dependent enzyme [Gemmatimonadota bacterium]MDE2983767.1 aminotransferase class I/II-fold pyridoxal phosphate-dependent enzyme [Gemmatimonadota bacterium]